MLSSEEIVISLRSLQALASKARMDVLRCLTSRRMTAAEVSSRLSIRKSSAHKHLLGLARAGFVSRHDDGDRVWIYYSLTHQGRHLVKSERPRLVLLLSASLLMVAGAFAFVAWRVYLWTHPDGTGTWGVDEIFPRPRPAFFTPGVVIAIVIFLSAMIAIARATARLTGSRQPDQG